tara:strand:+ start:597 stop:1481 length:885 start_codon:yes stop_codon:yes gene_type:complete
MIKLTDILVEQIAPQNSVVISKRDRRKNKRNKNKLPKNIEPQDYHLQGNSRKKRMTNLYLDKIKQEYELKGTPEKWERFLTVYKEAGSPKIVDPEHARGLQKIFSKRGFFNPLTKTIHGVEPMSDFESDIADTNTYIQSRFPNLTVDDIEGNPELYNQFVDVEPSDTVTDELTHALQFQPGNKRGKQIARFITKDLPMHINQTILKGKKDPYKTPGSTEHHAHTEIGIPMKQYINTGDREYLDKAIAIAGEKPGHDHDHDHDHSTHHASRNESMIKSIDSELVEYLYKKKDVSV